MIFYGRCTMRRRETRLLRCWRAGAWYNSSKCQAFEETFAAFQDAKYGIACTGGTVALEMICRGAGIGVGDEVITSAYTFIGTCSGILKAGATVVFCDIDPDTNNLDVAEVESLITDRTKGIMPVHFGGLACDLQRLLDIAERHNLVILEDAAHGWGSTYRDRGLGSWGLASGFSFQQSKNMTGGDGGIALTNDEAVADAIGCATNVGRSRYGRTEEIPPMGRQPPDDGVCRCGLIVPVEAHSRAYGDPRTKWGDVDAHVVGG